MRLAEETEGLSLQMGFWTFACPWGYKYKKSISQGRVLVRHEPLASTIAEALNGFATGRFQTLAEVKRFLESREEVPKNYTGHEFSFKKVASLLKNLLYAGYLVRPERNVPLTKAVHEPLISYETYLINQNRLNSKNVAPARKDIDKDFPLRGALVCEICGCMVTSCWSTSHTGKKYPYYLCQSKFCADKGKSTPRDKVEAEFDQLLKQTAVIVVCFSLAYFFTKLYKSLSSLR